MLSQHAQRFLIEASEAEVDEHHEGLIAEARYWRWVYRIDEFEFEPCDCDCEIAANHLDISFHRYGFCECQCQRCYDQRSHPARVSYDCFCEESMQKGHGDPQGHRYGTCLDCMCEGCLTQRLARKKAHAAVREMTVDQVRALVRYDDKRAVSDAILTAPLSCTSARLRPPSRTPSTRLTRSGCSPTRARPHAAEKAAWAAWEEEDKRFWQEHAAGWRLSGRTTGRTAPAMACWLPVTTSPTSGGWSRRRGLTGVPRELRRCLSPETG